MLIFKLVPELDTVSLFINEPMKNYLGCSLIFIFNFHKEILL